MVFFLFGCIILYVFFGNSYTLYGVKFKALLPYVQLIIYIVCLCQVLYVFIIMVFGKFYLFLLLFLLISALKIFFLVGFFLLNLLSRCWLIIRELLDFILYPYFKLVNIFPWLLFGWLFCWRLIIIVIRIIIIDIVA